ncbi:hypothetical protein BKC12_05115 [Salmonella enterica subsp. enterica serovar Typhimurium]|nr:hypothetical protein BKC12_05115 [Salmonella enterica subsp. enterica serovar Typhimurium]
MFSSHPSYASVLSSSNLLRQAEVTRQKLLNDSDNAIKDWRIELTLGIISDENKAALILPMNYINVLKSLDLTGVSDEATFTAIRWPALPQ